MDGEGELRPGLRDFLTPHDFVRRDDNLILVCNASGTSVDVLEVDRNDAKIRELRLDGGLAGSVALTPDGTLAFFIAPNQLLGAQTASLVWIDRAGNVERGGPALTTPTIAAVAADGTLIATSPDGIFAIGAGVVRWHRAAADTLAFVDRESTIVSATGATAIAFDVATGDDSWTLPIPSDHPTIASGGPGRVYVLTASSLTLIED